MPSPDVSKGRLVPSKILATTRYAFTIMQVRGMITSSLGNLNLRTDEFYSLNLSLFRGIIDLRLRSVDSDQHAANLVE